MIKFSVNHHSPETPTAGIPRVYEPGDELFYGEETLTVCVYDLWRF